MEVATKGNSSLETHEKLTLLFLPLAAHMTIPVLVGNSLLLCWLVLSQIEFHEYMAQYCSILPCLCLFVPVAFFYLQMIPEKDFWLFTTKM